ncbi:MAG: hypothetical protein P1U38_14325 [Aeromicrobium sp.]|uniref:hypothetical protein n=1 Tax=Aeromicrobium sp. TaxID=1871063 RepID=UPI002627423F|nr:hypothetical protein [Aeromicrobium sp.]MDF1705939.1 hypothetical protein [Aeromicrobium sp.]
MNRLMRTVIEFVAPTRIQYPEVPPMELGMTPNDHLQDAGHVDWVDEAEVDDVVAVAGGLAVAQGQSVLRRLGGGAAERIALPGRVTALASAGSHLVAAVSGHGLYRIDAQSQNAEVWCDEKPVRERVTALLQRQDGTTIVTVGSAERDLDEWAWDLLSRRATGSVVRIGGSGHVEQVRSDLAWPAGLAEDGDGAVVVALAHAHRLVRLDPLTLTTLGFVGPDLPAYPWRIAPMTDRGTWWVSMPLVRSRFTELMLGERDFLADMMSTVPPESWYGPSMAGGSVYREPLQLGGLRVLGQIKPWAPPRSYGLIAEIDADGRVVRSLHSRAGGSVHGVVAGLEHEGVLWLAARSRPGLLQVDLSNIEVSA